MPGSVLPHNEKSPVTLQGTVTSQEKQDPRPQLQVGSQTQPAAADCQGARVSLLKCVFYSDLSKLKYAAEQRQEIAIVGLNA